MRAGLLFFLFTISTALCSDAVYAQQLSLSLDSSGSRQVRPGSVSETLRLSVSRSGTVAEVDFLTGWQVSLVIVPEDGTLGRLDFDTASEPEVGYVFDSVGSLGVTTLVSDAELFAFDFHSPLSGGAELESNSSADLLQINLQASVDALGSFGVFAVPGPENSEWSDASQPIFSRREFANVRDDESPFRLATVIVAHPGDFDVDNDVDGDDFLHWQRGESFDPLSLNDLQDWSDNLGSVVSPISTATSFEAVPEPSTAVIAALAIGMASVIGRARGRLKLPLP